MTEALGGTNVSGVIVLGKAAHTELVWLGYIPQRLVVMGRASPHLMHTYRYDLAKGMVIADLQLHMHSRYTVQCHRAQGLKPC